MRVNQLWNLSFKNLKMNTPDEKVRALLFTGEITADFILDIFEISNTLDITKTKETQEFLQSLTPYINTNGHTNH
jgi:hypothetical protein